MTGGTFDKKYDELTGRLFFRDTHVPEMLRRGRCRLGRHDRHRHDDRQPGSGRRGARAASSSVRACERRDRDRRHARNRHDGARRRGRLPTADLETSTIVLTGAMVPYAFGSSDGLFNLGSARCRSSQVLPPGVYIAMNGQHFPWNGVRKNSDNRLSSNGDVHMIVDVTAAIEASVRRHDDLHGDVAARGRSRRDQPLAGIPGLRLRSGAGRGRRARTCAPDATSTRRCRACRRCARRSRRSTSEFYGRRYDPETEVTVTSGGTEAIFDAVAAVGRIRATR